MEEQQRKSVIFYKSFYESIRELTPEQQIEVYTAIFEYGLYGKEPKLSGIPKAVFALMRPQIEANNKRYDGSVKGGVNAAKGKCNGGNDVVKPCSKGAVARPKEKVKEKAKEKDNDNQKEKALGRDVEKINNCKCDDKDTPARAEIDSHIDNTLKIDFYRQLFSDNEQFADRLEALEEFDKILRSERDSRHVQALLCLDEKQCFKIFNALRLKDVEDKHNYAWKAIFDYAQQVKGG